MSWTATGSVIGRTAPAASRPHSGTWNAWLDGYGTTHTDTLSQSVTVPAGCHATLSSWLHIDTAETTTSTAFDKLTVQIGTTTLATFSNLNKAAGYTQRSFDVSASAGQTVTPTAAGYPNHGRPARPRLTRVAIGYPFTQGGFDVRIGAVIFVIWLVVGLIATAQRGYFSGSDTNCAKAGTTIVTIIAGPLNYVGVNPKVTCSTPQPSQ